MIKALIVEDSRVVQQLLAHILESDPDIQVVGVVGDGLEALPAVMQTLPDVITMDIHMPKLDGFEATRRIMEARPTPIVIVSGGYDVSEVHFSFQAVEAGAVAVISRPPGLGHPGYAAAAAELLQAVKLMSEVRVVTRKARAKKPSPPAPPAADEIRAVAIGASTGGPVVLQRILTALPNDLPYPLFIVQHIAEGFVHGFADWLADVSRFPLRIARQGEDALSGRGYLAPNGFHMEVRPGPRIVLSNHPPENGVRPSVACLFRSMAEVFGQQAVGILLTGMGSDGARELRLMRDRGAVTIAQDKASSLIHGMPGAAIAMDAAVHVLSPDSIASFLIKLAGKNQGAHDVQREFRGQTQA